MWVNKTTVIAGVITLVSVYGYISTAPPGTVNAASVAGAAVGSFLVFLLMVRTIGAFGAGIRAAE